MVLQEDLAVGTDTGVPMGMSDMYRFFNAPTALKQAGLQTIDLSGSSDTDYRVQALGEITSWVAEKAKAPAWWTLVGKQLPNGQVCHASA